MTSISFVFVSFACEKPSQTACICSSFRFPLNVLTFFFNRVPSFRYIGKQIDKVLIITRFHCLVSLCGVVCVTLLCATPRLINC